MYLRSPVLWTCLGAALFAAGAANGVPANPAPVILVERDSLSLSPAGDRVADVEARDPGNLPDEAHGAVVVRDATGKVLATYDPCKTCRYNDTAWSARGDLAFIATDYKTHKATLYVAAQGKLRALVTIDGYANSARWAPGGARIAILATPGAHKRPGAVEAGAAQIGEIGETNDEQRIAIVVPAGGALRYVSPADTYIYEFDWTPDGKGFIATGAKGNGDNNWWVATLDYVDAQTGALRIVAAPKVQMNLPRVSPDGKTVAFIGGLMSDWGPVGGDVYTVPLAGGTPRNVTPGFRGTFRGIAWRGNGLLTSALVDDQYEVVEVDPRSRQTRSLWRAAATFSTQRFDGAVVFSADGRTAATIAEDFTHAQEIRLGHLTGPAIAGFPVVTHDNAALPANVIAQSVHWTNDKFHLQGWLLRPKQTVAGRKYPMIVIVHGGPSSAATPRYVAAGGQHGVGVDFLYDAIARGYFVFYPNDRGSYGQGEAFTRANMRDFGRGDFRDMMTGVTAVEKIAPVDDARLGLFGASYGGWFAMWANTQTRRFKAIVAGSGISNWSSYYGTNGIDQWMVPFFGGSYYDDPAAYRAASPIEFIKRARTPTFMYVGERDVECPPTQSIEYWHGLRAIGTPTQLIIYPGQGHRIRKLGDLQDIRARTMAWFDKYLK